MMVIDDLMRAVRGEGDLAGAIAQIPYARFLDLAPERRDGRIVTTLRFSDMLLGTPRPPVLHGGTVGALLEIAGLLELMSRMKSDRLPRTIDISIDYLRAGQPMDTHASATVTRRGRRVANVRAEAWQQSSDKPIAAAQMHFLLS